MSKMSDMHVRIGKMARRTWETIADDVILLNEGQPVPQEEVIDMVSDGDYMGTHGGDAEAYTYFMSLPVDQAKELLREFFPHKSYR